MGEILASDLKTLHEQSDRTLAEWYCILNSWGWVDALPPVVDPLPEKREWDKHQPSRRGLIMAWIHEKVGEKLCSFVWNTWHRQGPGRMTEEQFEKWWSERHIPWWEREKASS